MKRVIQSIGIGIVATFAMIGLAFVVDDAGYEDFAQYLNWPNLLLQNLAPPHNIGTADHHFLEGSPLNVLAFYASIPFGTLIYGCVAFVTFRLRRRTSHLARP